MIHKAIAIGGLGVAILAVGAGILMYFQDQQTQARLSREVAQLKSSDHDLAGQVSQLQSSNNGLVNANAVLQGQLDATRTTCYLGHPNSSFTAVVQVTGPAAPDICNDLTNPIRSTNTLKGTSALAGHPWAPMQVCSFVKYGMSWTVWDVPAATTGNCGWLQNGI